MDRDRTRRIRCEGFAADEARLRLLARFGEHVELSFYLAYVDAREKEGQPSTDGLLRGRRDRIEARVLLRQIHAVAPEVYKEAQSVFTDYVRVMYNYDAGDYGPEIDKMWNNGTSALEPALRHYWEKVPDALGYKGTADPFSTDTAYWIDSENSRFYLSPRIQKAAEAEERRRHASN